MYKKIDIGMYAKIDCPHCHGEGYVDDDEEDQVYCTCVTEESMLDVEEVEDAHRV